MDNNNLIDAIRINAIEEFSIKSVTPLFGIINKKIDHIGTGTFFRKGDKRLLITANHIFDNIDKSEGIYCAKCPTKKPKIFEPYLLKKFDILNPNKELKDTIDIAIIELLDQSDIRLLEKNWNYLDIKQIQGKKVSDIHGTVIITGYPSNRLSKSFNTSSFMTAYTKSLESAPQNTAIDATPYDSRVDMYFEYQKNAISIPNNKTINTPNAIGMSGCPIWEYVSSEGIWSPEKSLEIIGIQSAFYHKQYIRGKSSFIINELLEKAFGNNSSHTNVIEK